MRLKWFDIVFIGILLLALGFVYANYFSWLDKRTYDPLHPHTFDEYSPDDGTNKGLIITEVEIPPHN